MRNSNLLKWAQNMNNKSGKDAENRNWIHPPEALSRGHIAYLVKFLGNLEVDQPKGIEVVKEGIRKLKFNQQNIRKSEGSKLPKVELTISVDGVAIQEPKTKRIMHQYPLHRISYCADDKAERRFFSFIVKETPDSEQHMCFVFLSDKLAEDITLTIGQAFDLAYKLSQNDAIWTTSWCGGSKASKRTFRSCHLDVNKPLPIYYSDELPDLVDYCAGRAVPQMPSGMEKDEEAEHHLQRAMVTGHVIPTPEVYPIDPALYDMLYPAVFSLPRRLIHMQPFTLEQDIPEYDIDSEDEEWLRSQAKSIDLPNEKFEEMVDRLERNSDHTVVSEQDAKSLLRDYDEGLIIAVYDYWLNKRFKTKHNLMPQVRTEVRGNTAVNDPYLAFRRRKDKMQTRKNRKNDESSYEKMIKLSLDLTSAQDLVEMIKKRELLKKDLVQVSIDLFKKRYELEDWTGQQYQEAVLVSKLLRHNKYNNTWASHPAHKKNNYLDDDLVVKKEKRHYKKRKLKSVTPPCADREVQMRLSSDDETPVLAHTVEDNYFTFRRAPGVSYHATKPALGDWPWVGGDVRHRFNPVLIRTPTTRCIGLARRRVGRGGRVILDRLGPPLDDLWRDLDVTVLEGQRHFRPKTPPNSFSDESEAEDTGKVDTLKPYLEVEESTRSTHINISFNKPFQIEGDTTTNILERISEDTGHGSILDPFYKSLIKKRLDLLKTSSSLVERWNKLSTPVDVNEEVPYSYEESIGSASLRLTNSRKSFLDTAACERVAQKRKYDARASSSRDLDEAPRCGKCRKVRREDEALGRSLRERNDRVRGETDVKRIVETLVFYLTQRVEINEQIRAELRARLSSVQRDACVCVTSRHRLSCPLYDPSNSHPPPPRLPSPPSSLIGDLSHTPPTASSSNLLSKDRSSSDLSTKDRTSPSDLLFKDHRTLDSSTCICDIFPSTSANSSSSTICSLVSSGLCLLSNSSGERGTRTSGLGDGYLLPESGMLVRRTQDCLVDTDRRFLEMEAQRRLMVLQARVHSLEAENLALKTRLSDLALCDDVSTYMRAHGIKDLTRVEVAAVVAGDALATTNGAGDASSTTRQSQETPGSGGASVTTSNGELNGMTSLLLNLSDPPSTPAVSNGSLVPPVPPRSFQNDLLSDLVLSSSGPAVGRKLEGLLLDDMLEDDDEFDPRAHEAGGAPPTTPGPPLLAPPPPPSHRRGGGGGGAALPVHEDVFGLTPFNDKGSDGGSVSRDPFGMGDFGLGGMGSVNNAASGGGGSNAPGSRDLESAIGLLDRRILEMKDGFSRGLSIGTEDFSIESLDPLRK